MKEKEFKWIDYNEWYFNKFGKYPNSDDTNIEKLNNQYKQEFFE